MISDYRWVPHVFALELKKTFSYRVTFWVQFLMGTGTEFAVSYFVWMAVFSAMNTPNLGGFTFHGLVYYSLFANFAAKITRGTDRGYFSQEIYDGTLNRYLLYPLPFFPYKYVTHLNQQLMGVTQLLLTWFFLWLLLGREENLALTPVNFLLGFFTCLLTGYLHFVMMSCLELVAFWQDVVWNLMVMLRFAMNLLGGGMIPLVLFPEWAQRVVHYTPFPYLVSFPARTFLGQITLQEWLVSFGNLVCWSIVFSFLLNYIWRQGTKQYSGVGI